MPNNRDDLEHLFVAHLPLIERILRALCVRNGFHGDDADDACSWVKLRLIENDYGVLAKFRGESSLANYLAVVLAMQVREYRVSQWGRWRPSAAAQARGAIAVRLETLTRRDGLSVQQAAEMMRTGRETEMSVGDLARLAAELPNRVAPRPHLVNADTVPPAADDRQADSEVLQQQADREHATIRTVLSKALAGLEPEEQVILRMRFWHGLSIADIARGLSRPAKPLYRKMEKLLFKLRDSLEAAGISGERFRALLDESMPAGDQLARRATGTGRNAGSVHLPSAMSARKRGSLEGAHDGE
jgi:RNA polymerase sigma factor (sigma-70 family)